jgi:hypothetical protein
MLCRFLKEVTGFLAGNAFFLRDAVSGAGWSFLKGGGRILRLSGPEEESPAGTIRPVAGRLSGFYRQSAERRSNGEFVPIL